MTPGLLAPPSPPARISRPPRRRRPCNTLQTPQRHVHAACAAVTCTASRSPVSPPDTAAAQCAYAPPRSPRAAGLCVLPAPLCTQTLLLLPPRCWCPWAALHPLDLPADTRGMASGLLGQPGAPVTTCAFLCWPVSWTPLASLLSPGPRSHGTSSRPPEAFMRPSACASPPRGVSAFQTLSQPGVLSPQEAASKSRTHRHTCGLAQSALTCAPVSALQPSVPRDTPVATPCALLTHTHVGALSKHQRTPPRLSDSFVPDIPVALPRDGSLAQGPPATPSKCWVPRHSVKCFPVPCAPRALHLLLAPPCAQTLLKLLPDCVPPKAFRNLVQSPALTDAPARASQSSVPPDTQGPPCLLSHPDPRHCLSSFQVSSVSRCSSDSS